MDYEQLVYWNPKRNIKKNLMKFPYGDIASKVANDIVHLNHENKIIRIDKEGEVTVLLNNVSSYWSGNEIVYSKQGIVGSLNIINGSRSEISSGGIPAFTINKSGDSFYGIYDRKLYYLDFVNKKIEALDLKSVNNIEIGGEWAFFKEYTDGDYGNFWAINKRETLKLFEGNLYELYAPTKPSILSDKRDDVKLLWLPDSLTFVEIQSTLFKEFSSHEFISRVGSQYYFLTRDSQDRRFLLVLDSEKKSCYVENRINYQSNYFTNFNSTLYYTNDIGFWTSKGEDVEHLSSLNSPPLYLFNEDIFVVFKSTLYAWANDKHGVRQLYELDKQNSEDILLYSENPNINFSFYPNPTQDYLNVSSTSEAENKYKITVFSTDGKVISEQHLELPQKLDLSGLKAGVYLINVRAGKDNKTFRVVKQ